MASLHRIVELTFSVTPFDQTYTWTTQRRVSSMMKGLWAIEGAIERVYNDLPQVLVDPWGEPIHVARLTLAAPDGHQRVLTDELDQQTEWLSDLLTGAKVWLPADTVAVPTPEE